jgi:predicted DNA-binding antitoxin AbrB/MazE fold protein
MGIRAVYENGVFKPLESVPLREGTEVEVYPRAEERENGGKRRKSVRELGAYGMWADRADIGEGTEYVERIRRLRHEPEAK